MKILLVHNAYRQPGGEEVVFEQERKLLERAGHQVSLYVRNNRDADQCSGLSRIRLAKQTVWSSGSKLEVANLLQDHQPDLVHIHNTFMMISPSIYWACREAGVPVVQTLHNFRLYCPGINFYRESKPCEDCVQHSLWRAVRHGCYRHSHSASAVVATMLALHRKWHTWTNAIDCYIALTQFARQKFIVAGLPANKIVVKPNFVDPDPGIGNGDRQYAIFVGRLSPEKGIETLISAWKALPVSIPLHIIGDGPYRTSLERANCGSAMRLYGHVSHDETLAAIKRAQFLILPSQCYENCPLTIIEAFACGTPVLCARLGAMQEIVADGRTGLHFAPGDPTDLALKAHWAWNHFDELAAMGKRARDEYESRYAAAENYSMLMDIYGYVVDKSQLRSQIGWARAHLSRFSE